MKPEVLAYLKKLPNANTGEGGHTATLRAALACKRFGLGAAEILEHMQWWNENKCTPRWSEKELRHKVDSVADTSINKPLGRREFTPRTSARVFKADPLPAPKIDPRPIIKRSEQDEELWWARVAAERGVSLQEWDDPQGGKCVQ